MATSEELAKAFGKLAGKCESEEGTWAANFLSEQFMKSALKGKVDSETPLT